MLLRMLVGLSGNEYSLGPGEERDFPTSEALRLISAGFSVPVAEQKIELAAAAPIGERRGRKGRANVVSGENNDSGN